MLIINVLFIKKINYEPFKLLKKNGYNPIIVVLESNFKDEYLNSKEDYWIKRTINDGHILLNQRISILN